MDENRQDSPQAAQSGVDMDDLDAGFNDGLADGEQAVAESPESFTAPKQTSSEQAMPEQTSAEPSSTTPQAASEQGAPYQPPATEQVQPVAQAAQAAHAQQQAMEAHNRNFQQVLRTEHPDLFAPKRTPEQNQRLMADMQTWIEAKPYAEARGLMDIYENGRDPRQVAALLTRFKQETGATGASGAGKKTAVDPTAMMAVAGRGAPVVPKAVGGKDDFEAGWNL